jgi:hypothetical protein
MKLPINIVVILSLILAGCDPQTNYKMVVQNASEYEILIQPGNHQIASGNEKAIYEYHGIGGPGSNGKCELGIGGIGTATTEIPSHPELKITLNISNMDNWTYSREGNGMKGYNVQCRIQITDADIVPK